MQEKLSKIYKITNLKNGYIYIGSTSKDIHKRLVEHFKSAKQGITTNMLYEDMRNQSKEDFEIVEIDTCFERHRYIVESYWTKKYRDEYFYVYNKKDGNEADKNTAQRLSNLRMSDKYDNIYKSDQFRVKVSMATTGEKNGMYGRKGDNAINGRIVLAWEDKEHTILAKEFVSQLQALEFIKVKGHSGMNKAVKNNELYHNYYWTKEWIDR